MILSALRQFQEEKAKKYSRSITCDLPPKQQEKIEAASAAG